MEILAFPYAYGSAKIYSELLPLRKNFSFHAFDYPGHGSRLEETPLKSISDIADDAIKQIGDYINRPYCLLGYSMGGNVVFEIYQKLKKAEKSLPKYVFILGSHEPSWIHDKYDFENFNLEQVKDVLRKKNGTSEEILNEDELISLLSPSIIADSIALRDYSCSSNNTLPFDCGITIIRGSMEEKTEKCKEEWERFLKRQSEYILVDGNHFFLFQGSENVKNKVCNIIIERLNLLK